MTSKPDAAATKALTMKEWRTNARAMSAVFTDAEKLLEPMERELLSNRALLTVLLDIISPKLTPWHEHFSTGRGSDYKSAHAIIDERIAAINAVLGDRP